LSSNHPLLSLPPLGALNSRARARAREMKLKAENEF
jgi:hypothetical protein